MKSVFQLQPAVGDLVDEPFPVDVSDSFFPPLGDACDGAGRRLPVFPVEAQKPQAER